MRAQAPHCDASVLHTPGQCKYCDEYPDHQEARKLARVAFTGQRPIPPGYKLCPSELRRPLERIELWGGNRAKTPEADLPRSPEGAQPPPSKGEIMADKSNVLPLGPRRPGGAESWTPREALQHIMDQIDRGELQADNLVIGVLTILPGGRVGLTTSFSSPNALHTLGILELMRDEAKVRD